MDSKQRRPSEAKRPASRKRPAQDARRTGSATAAPVRKRRRTSASATASQSQVRRPVQNRKPAPRKRRPAPDVVYTPPQPFNRNRLLLRLATVVAVVLALSFGISIFFKVKTVTVSGAQKYTAWAVREASGIAEGDNLLSFGKAKACGRITAALPYVDTARIGIKLPDTVNIEIKEFDIVYSIKGSDNSWWLISTDGQIIEGADSATAGDYTKVLGVQLAAPAPDTKAVAYELPVQETTPEGVTVPITVKASEKLSAALSILQYLEDNGIIGEVVSVDVSDLGNIQLWYGTQYQIMLGDTTQLSYKISSMKKAVTQMDAYHSGVLDVSFTYWPNEVGYTPFP